MKVTDSCEGLFTQKKSSYNPQKIRKIQKIQGFFSGLKIRIPYFGVKNSSKSAFKSFFNYKILVHQKKISNNPKNPRIFLRI